MKAIFLLCVALLPANRLVAQFARIEDKDGFVNVRSKPGASSPVLTKVFENEVFWCFTPEGEWYPVDCIKAGKTLSGYVHGSRVKFIHQILISPKSTTRKTLTGCTSAASTVTGRAATQCCGCFNTGSCWAEQR